MDNQRRWQYALNELWATNRVHISEDMSKAYRKLMEIYPGCTLHQYASGEHCGYWIAPPGWDVTHARLYAPSGECIADWDTQKLALFCYSPSFQGEVSREELEQHLFSIPDMPERTGFHFRNMYRHWEVTWGFSIPDSLRKKLPAGNYKVDIETNFNPNAQMEMVEQVHQGEHEDSVLFVGHFDHPYMCNDGLMGCLAGHELLTRLENKKTRLTYRMLSTVEIVGSVFYAEEFVKEKKIREATFLATSAADAPLVYQTSFSATSYLDRAFQHVLKHLPEETTILPFRDGIGNDEIAFDVNGVDVSCGSLMRYPFKEYHTELDNPETVKADKFEQVLSILEAVVYLVENNSVLHRKFNALPCLSHPDLNLYLPPLTMSNVKQHAKDSFESVFVEHLTKEEFDVAVKNPKAMRDMMTYVPLMCNGEYTIFDIAEKVGLPFRIVDVYLQFWQEKDLLEKEWVNPYSKNGRGS